MRNLATLLVAVSVLAVFTAGCVISNDGCPEESAAAGDCSTQGVPSGTIASDSLPTFIQVDPNGTYLTVVEPGSSPSPPTSVSLATLGVQGGTLLYMANLGFFSSVPGEAEDNGEIYAIFVDADGASYPPGPGSLQEIDTVTLRTCPSYLETDIPNDFHVPQAEIEVPEEATQIQFTPWACYFGDNEDADGDFGVLIDLWDG